MPLYRQFDSQAQLDAEYDVDGSVPNFLEYVERLLAASERARATLEHFAALPYGPTRDETLDVFPAVREQYDTGLPPILVFFHGGYWRQLTSAEFNFVALGLARAGVTVVIPTYSLCPKVTMDEIVRQARAAVAWTYRHASTIGGDPARLYVGGHSAGGHLATMCALTDWAGEYALRPDLVRGVVPVSGLFDLRPLPFTCVGPSLQLDAAQVARNSPALLALPPSLPPMLASVGGAESAEFQRQTAEMVQRWQDAGAAAELVPQLDANHFDAVLPFADPDSALVQLVAEFIGVDAGVPA